MVTKKVGIILLIIGGVAVLGLALLAYYFFGYPGVESTSIANEEKDVPITKKIEVVFSSATNTAQSENMAIENAELVKVEGNWEATDDKHFVFNYQSNVSLFPETNYKITIKPLSLAGRAGKNVEINFTTGTKPDGFILSAETIKPYNKLPDDRFEEGLDPGFGWVTSIPIKTAYFEIVAADPNTETSGGVTVHVRYLQDKEKSKAALTTWLKERKTPMERVYIEEYSG